MKEKIYERKFIKNPRRTTKEKIYMLIFLLEAMFVRAPFSGASKAAPIFLQILGISEYVDENYKLKK